MKATTRIYMHLFLILVFSGLISTTGYGSDSLRFTRNFEKTFEVKPEVLLDLELNYSQVNITTWDQDEVKIQGEVVAYAQSEEASEKIFDKITVDLYGNELEVGLITNFNSQAKPEENDNFELIFNIQVPRSANILGRTEFTKINLPTIDGAVDVMLHRGELRADTLLHSDTQIISTYGDASISEFSGGKINFSFGTLKIGVLSGDLNLMCEYSDVICEEVTAGCEELTLSNEFGKIRMKLSNQVNYTVRTETSFGKVMFPEDVNGGLTRESELDKEIREGTFGSGPTDCNIKAFGEFGDFEFSF